MSRNKSVQVFIVCIAVGDQIIKMGRIGIKLSRWGELGLHYQDGGNWDYIINMRGIGITLSRWGELGLIYHDGGELGLNYKDGKNWDQIIKMGKIEITLTGSTLPHFCSSPK